MSQCPSPLPKSAPHPAPVISTSAGSAILALDLGTTTGWASLAGGIVHSGTASFRSGRYDGGGMRYLRFQHWLEQLADDSGGLAAIYFEEVRRHIGTDAAHLYGGFLATLTAWCEREGVAYGERWKTICWTVGLQRSAAHEHWLYALCVIAWRLNQRKIPRLRSRRYVIEMVKGACEDPASHPN